MMTAVRAAVVTLWPLFLLWSLPVLPPLLGIVFGTVSDLVRARRPRRPWRRPQVVRVEVEVAQSA